MTHWMLARCRLGTHTRTLSRAATLPGPCLQMTTGNAARAASIPWPWSGRSALLVLRAGAAACPAALVAVSLPPDAARMGGEEDGAPAEGGLGRAAAPEPGSNPEGGGPALPAAPVVSLPSGSSSTEGSSPSASSTMLLASAASRPSTSWTTVLSCTELRASKRGSSAANPQFQHPVPVAWSPAACGYTMTMPLASPYSFKSSAEAHNLRRFQSRAVQPW
mmetsp:Transcript_23974/g.71678  ORF Transcript_23974/g.71678 Transcript_23974/m.71678 type:complete len:220 (-) Transcript_23974:842-1501(-)